MCILLTTSAHTEYPFILISNRDEYFKRPTATVRFVTENILSPFDLAKDSHGTWCGVTKTGRIGILVNYRENIIDDSQSYLTLSRGAIVNDFLTSDLDPEVWQRDFFAKHKDTVAKVGGFSFLFGALKIDEDTGKIAPLRIISNRGATSEIFLPKEPVSTSTANITSPSSRRSSTGVKSSTNSRRSSTHSTATKIIINSDSVSDNSNEPTAPLQYRENKSYIGLSNSLFLEPWPKVLIGENLLNNLSINVFMIYHR